MVGRVKIYVRRVARWQSSMEVSVANKWQKGQRSKLAAKKVECGPMLVDTRSGVGWKKTTHRMDKTTNWCIGEAGSLWPIIISVVRFWFSVSVSSDSWAIY